MRIVSASGADNTVAHRVTSGGKLTCTLPLAVLGKHWTARAVCASASPFGFTRGRDHQVRHALSQIARSVICRSREQAPDRFQAQNTPRGSASRSVTQQRARGI